ncbi:DUF4367 domain-containing protein [bacterium]|nr:DUF4367 domain-containing protein [bacterium]
MTKNKNLDPKLNEQLNKYYDVDPRPGFLPELRHDLQDRYTTRPAMRLKLRPALALAGAMIALVLVLFATPVGDALGQVLVELFQTAEDDVLPYPPAQTAIAEYTMTAALGPTNTPMFTATKTPDVTPTPEPGYLFAANMTVDEAEQVAGFDILVPVDVPEYLAFRGVAYQPEDNITRIYYDLIGRRTNGLSVAQEPVTGMEDCDLCADIGPSADVKEVQIGDVTGQYVAGTWILEDGYQIWKNNHWLKRLIWQTDDTVFELTFFGPPSRMLSKDLVEVAESMVSEIPQPTPSPTATPLGAAETPDPSLKENANLTLEEVEQAAGFDVLAPIYHPELHFYGANFDPNTNIVYLFYEEGMILRQEPTTGLSDCDICAEVRKGATYRDVQVGDVEAQYAFGVWNYVDPEGLPFAVAQPKQLRWQDNNTVYEILYDNDPSDLNIEDLIKIAESYR